MDNAIEILEVLIKNSKTQDSGIEYALAEIKKEKMKTCTSCKYGHLDPSRYLPVHKCDLGCNSVDFDFCCNRHKYKEKQNEEEKIKKSDFKQKTYKLEI